MMQSWWILKPMDVAASALAILGREPCEGQRRIRDCFTGMTIGQEWVTTICLSLLWAWPYEANRLIRVLNGFY